MQPTITAEYLASQGLSENFPQRFWPKVNKDGPFQPHCPELGQCWVWTAGKYGGGYGATTFRHGKPLKAHRASWLLHYGPIPAGLCVLHKCDNPPCVRPDHLFAGTDLDNVRDRNSKNRQGGPHRGEANHNAKRTWQIVNAAREMFAAGISQREIGRRLNLDWRMVWIYVHHRAWKIKPSHTLIAQAPLR